VLRKFADLAAVTLVLLPIGGLVLLRPADVAPAAGAVLAVPSTAGDAVPEPTVLLLVCLGGAGLLTRRATARRR